VVEQVFHKLSAGVNDVLAVVEHQEQRTRRQSTDERSG
jgi:hypothetical protein